MIKHTMSVIQLNTYIKHIFEQDYVLKSVSVEGELSNFKQHSSGHIYFTLKDDKAQVSCVLFKGYLTGEEKTLKDGAKVIVKGSVSLFEKTGQYQIYVHSIEKAGIGDLYLLFEKLKKELKEEGIFEDSRKKAIPKFAVNIGIITSQTGAALRDIVEIARRRNPYVQLILYPSLVQGDMAKYDIVKGIEYFNTREPVDVIILGRGGGSIEDLWPFNEAMVARAIAASQIPIISAVGHETDFTISDFAADLRASTPSAATELAVFDYEEWKKTLFLLQHRLIRSQSHYFSFKREQLVGYQMRLMQRHPKKQVQDKRLYIDYLVNALQRNMNYFMTIKRHEIELLQQRLLASSPTKSLEEGYAIVSINGNRIKNLNQLKPADVVHIHMQDGVIKANIDEIEVY